jgi:hypothetical protein
MPFGFVVICVCKLELSRPSTLMSNSSIKRDLFSSQVKDLLVFMLTGTFYQWVPDEWKARAERRGREREREKNRGALNQEGQSANR